MSFDGLAFASRCMVARTRISRSFGLWRRGMEISLLILAISQGGCSPVDICRSRVEKVEISLRNLTGAGSVCRRGVHGHTTSILQSFIEPHIRFIV
jgi:hypothetical protein